MTRARRFLAAGLRVGNFRRAGFFAAGLRTGFGFGWKRTGSAHVRKLSTKHSCGSEPKR